MTPDSIRSDVENVLSQFIRSLPANVRISDASSLKDDLKIDSADMVELVLELEGRFKILVPDAAMDEVKTMGQIVRLVESLVYADASAR